jgi:hypothetical protein
MSLIPIYSIKLDKDDKRSGVSLISFVENPAIQANFVSLSQQQEVKLARDEMKRILTGPVLIPEKQILRQNGAGEYYYITFSSDVIEQIRDKFFREGNISNTNSEHEIALSGNYVVESWIVTNPEKDKSVALGLGEQAPGTWMVSYKVDDKEFWEKEILTGKRKGFSLEGIFDYEPVEVNTIIGKYQKHDFLSAEDMKYKAYLEQSKGYKREQMPQIPHDAVYDLISYFKIAYGHEKVWSGNVQLQDILPTQSEFNEDKITAKKLSDNWRYRTYLIDKDNYLLDGHHDWAAGLEQGENSLVYVTKINLPVEELIDVLNSLKITTQESLSFIKLFTLKQ